MKTTAARVTRSPPCERDRRNHLGTTVSTMARASLAGPSSAKLAMSTEAAARYRFVTVFAVSRLPCIVNSGGHWRSCKWNPSPEYYKPSPSPACLPLPLGEGTGEGPPARLCTRGQVGGPLSLSRSLCERAGVKVPAITIAGPPACLLRTLGLMAGRAWLAVNASASPPASCGYPAQQGKGVVGPERALG